MSSKLHELLAVESGVKDEFTKMAAETLANLGKPHLFSGSVKVLRITKEMDAPTKVAMESAGASKVELTTTVDARLKYDGKFFQRRVNLQLQKDLTNQEAVADLVIGGMTLQANLPGIFLLSLEQLLIERRKLYAAAPTLAAGLQWVVADQAGVGIYRNANPGTELRTEKSFKVVSLAKATDKHPEQVEKLNIDVPIGVITTETTSGMWTSARKAEVMARCDALISAVREARARANATVVVGQEIDLGTALLNFIEAAPVSATK